MPRGKVKLGWIMSESARKSSFNKRKVGLLKKVIELSILCGVDACIIIFGQGSNLPIIWPDRQKAEELIHRYLSLPGYLQSKKTRTQDSYLNAELSKMQVKHDKIFKSNIAKEMNEFMRQDGNPLYGLEFNQTCRLLKFVEEKMKEILNRMAYFQQAAGPCHTSVQSALTNNLGVSLGTGREWPYGTFRAGGDGSGSGTEIGFQMTTQRYGNNIGGSSSINVVSYNGNVGTFEGGNIRVPLVGYVGNNNIIGYESQMRYPGMLPQYYDANVMTSDGTHGSIERAIGGMNGESTNAT